ncbi:MAG: MFS transporter [Paenibacillus macerans]|uniref:MFS transporter n=1 Tax=Paenibacillus macerans TaxID=44252 RepID=A0A090Y6P2_PAEMA|nr:MFS transporter [Paenibacillus macerans]KFM93497.1 major Facilitator Superfamily protein [Paenibacillus macerans]MBS5914854.1 MFS transporter [Paenibacillus macerans]MCY7562605.1 MFS transporter [Paenibacillus macerans]MDU5946086.1 MFS transporter [Paenibacillus macerans]MDU7477336.1 MFS transporter [Paenibacillus macerans]
MPRKKSLLRDNRSFRNLWLAQTGSTIGDWFNQVALAQTTLALTNSAAGMGLVLLCRSFPGFILGPLISPLVDHLPKKKIMIATDLLRALFALSFIAAIAADQSFFLYAGAFLLGLSGVMFNPASQAYLPHIVKQEELAEANAISSTTSGFVSVISTILGGIVSALVSPVLCFAINSASYLWSALCVSKLTSTSSTQSARKSFSYFRSLSEGFKEVKQNTVARMIIIIGISWGLAGGGYYILIPLIGDSLIGLEGFGIGLLYAVDGLGVITGSLLVKSYIKHRITRMNLAYGIAYVTQAVFFAGIALSANIYWAALMLLCMRVSSGIIIPLDTSLMQMNTPPDVRGRVFALHGSTYSGFMQLSYVTSSLLFVNMGIPFTGVLIGSISFLCGLYWLVGMRKQQTSGLSTTLTKGEKV